MTGELAVDADWVRERIKEGAPLILIEVRHAGDLDLAVMKARGALRLTHDEAQLHPPEIPAGATVVVYSSAPDDNPAAALVRLLQSRGASGVRLLAGGFRAYLGAGLPVEDIGEGRNMTRLRGL